MKYQKRPVVIEATQWFKNGDHPLDYAEDRTGFEGGILRTFPADHAKTHDWEGDVVRRYRRPDDNGERPCGKCGQTMHVHGWVDTLEGGHVVCPGDWIITGVKGEHYPCKPDIFAATYELVSDHLSEANKMVSATPRTDVHIVGLRRDPEVSGCNRSLDFARQLERELNAANDRIRQLIAERDTARAQADQKVSLREEFRELLGTDKIEEGVAAVTVMKERIKQLEDRIKRASKAFFRDGTDRQTATGMLAILEEERRTP